MNRSVVAVFVVMLFCIQGVLGKDIYDNSIKPGDTKLKEYLPILRNKRIGLIINQTSQIGGVSLLDILINKKVNVKKIFVPEHGFRGSEDAGAKIDNSIDSATRIPVISLYGKHKQPTTEDLEGIDVLVYDLQDVGVRFYTYISTLEYCMEAAAQHNKEFIVLDRPNPNGFYLDGPVLENDYRSFVGMQRIPVVYGMTAGEYAMMLTGEKWFKNAEHLDLKVIKCAGYTHDKKYKLPVAPSPNLRTMAAVYAYPALCLFEGTVVSVGRGTDLPFQQYGCPEFEGKFTYSFTPKSSKGAKNPLYQDKVCYGELVNLHDGDEAFQESAILTFLDNRYRLNWLIKAYNAYPDKKKFFNDFFVKLTGNNSIAEQIKSGVSEKDIWAAWEKDLTVFKNVRKKYLLYKDF